MARLLLAATLLLFYVGPQAMCAETVVMVSNGRTGLPAKHALSRLKSTIRQRGLELIERKEIPNEGEIVLFAGTAKDARVTTTLQTHEMSLPNEDESLLIATVPNHAPPLVVIAGHDDRGLAYALYEVARAIETGSRNTPLIDLVRNSTETPFLRTRGMQVQIFNEDLERSWYFDEEYWRGYFGMLVASRYNNFTLTFGHQTNYMNPVYAWLVEVAQYPDVCVKGVTNDDRQRNLRMLDRISRLASAYGLDFTLGVWTQQPVEKYGPSPVENFPEGKRAGDYCAQALGQVLTACPKIDAVQFRMNVEAGIAEEEQNEYFRQQFRGVLMCPRPVRMDLRFKGLRPQTIADAVATGRDVTVSTKFWCEHMGLPFHPTIEDDLYRESRYGYGAMLYKPRKYRVIYRLWTVGSQRLLLWGDSDYAARFARSCTLGGGEGFEVFAPLSNKGFGNDPGNWSILADQRLNHFKHEYERYWLFYQVFGRAGYNPGTTPAVWSREFKHRFGAAGRHLEQAFRQASQIIPLLTATKLFGASEWRFWPEVSTGGLLDAYIHIQPSDYGQFYAIERWKPVDGWLAEPWAARHTSFVEDALADRVQGKWTPIQVSARLLELAEGTESALARAATDQEEKSPSSEFFLTVNDLRILAQLARYHSKKTLAATQLAFYRRTREPGRLQLAAAHIRHAESAWESIVELTSGVYSDDLVFGYSEQRAPSIDGVIRAHTGHWKDRLPEIRRDTAAVDQMVRAAGLSNKTIPFQKLPGEVTPEDRPQIVHQRVKQVVPGSDVEIVAAVQSHAPLREAILHHRPMNQTLDWKQVPMKRIPDGRFKATIPAEDLTEKYDHLYYIEARVAGGGTLWPNWEDTAPYVVLKTTR